MSPIRGGCGRRPGVVLQGRRRPDHAVISRRTPRRRVRRRHAPPVDGRPRPRARPHGPGARCAVDRGHDGLQGGRQDVRVDAHPPKHPIADRAFDVRRRLGVAARRQRVLRRSRAPEQSTPYCPSASKNAAMGPLPVPSSVRPHRRRPDRRPARSRLRRRALACRIDSSENRPHGVGRRPGRYSSMKIAQICVGRHLAALGVGVRLHDAAETRSAAAAAGRARTPSSGGTRRRPCRTAC